MNNQLIEYIRDTKLFEFLTSDALLALVDHFEREFFDENSPIITEGELGDHFYLILSGAVRVYTEKEGKEIVLARLEKGDFFGEQALLNIQLTTYNSSARALIPVEVIKISHKTFQDYIKNNNFLKAFLKEAPIGSQVWNFVKITDIRLHTPYIRSYKLQSLQHPLTPSKAGQHIVIEAFIDNQWVARTYTLTSIDSDKDYEITVREESLGLFSPWMFANDKDPILLRVSQPKGDFTIDEKETTPILCFVAGTGLTPAVAFTRKKLEIDSKRIIHIDYSIHSLEDAIFREELNNWSKKCPEVTVNIRITGKTGRIQTEEIRQIALRYPEADIYVCGPKGYIEKVIHSLRGVVKNEKIHVEQFTHASAS